MAYTTDDIILWGKISQPFAVQNETYKRVFEGGAIDVDLDIKLYVERKSVEWYNSQTTVDTDILYQISNWLFALEGVWGIKAQFIDGGSGGIVSGVTPGASAVLPDPLDWEITGMASGTSPLADGQSYVYLNGTLGMPNFIGYNIEFTRGNATQYTTPPPDGISTYYSWDRDIGLFKVLADTFPFGAAQLGEQFRILPTR